MKVTLMSFTPGIEELCGFAAAKCTNSKHPDSALRHSVESGHDSVLEHAVFTFDIDGISRACLAQLTRHRLASFSVQSQRYVKLDENIQLVIPESIAKLEGDLGKRAIEHMIESMRIYCELVDAGVPAEDARYITPQAVPTSLIVTMNCRELLHFFKLRTCNRAQWEIRAMADIMLRKCMEVAPYIFGNAGPDCVRDGCHELRSCGHPRSMEEWKN